jgi:uncharacterized protein YneR
LFFDILRGYSKAALEENAKEVCITRSVEKVNYLIKQDRQDLLYHEGL